MTVEVRLPNILRPLAAGQATLEADGTTLREVFEDLVRRYPGLASSLLTPEGDMHRHLNVFLNDDDVRYLGRLEAKVSSSDTVTLMPAVAGGASGLPALAPTAEAPPRCQPRPAPSGDSGSMPRAALLVGAGGMPRPAPAAEAPANVDPLPAPANCWLLSEIAAGAGRKR